MQVSRETDLKQLKDLGFNMYGDVNIAKRKLYESISNGDRKNADLVMFNRATSKNYSELKTLLKKNDYMQRCTNTNAKASVIALLLLAEFQSIIAAPGADPMANMKGIINCFTERKISPITGTIPTFSDLIDVLSILPEHYISEDFYQNLLDYLANMVFEFGM